MTDVSRQAFAQLMNRVEELEEAVEAQEAVVKARQQAGDGDAAGKAAAELERLQEDLRLSREELARLSDGCGRGHHHV
jgi:multidrug resistance efflux pump